MTAPVHHWAATTVPLPLCGLWRDPLFLLALLAGPLFWAVLWLTARPEIQGLGPLDAPLAYLTVALIFPVLEEIVFRGLLQGALRRRSWARRGIVGVTPANLLTSVLFALLHGLQHPPLWAVSVFFPSLVFGFFRDRYESVYPGSVLHVFYNSGFFFLFSNT